MRRLAGVLICLLFGGCGTTSTSAPSSSPSGAGTAGGAAGGAGGSAGAAGNHVFVDGLDPGAMGMAMGGASSSSSTGLPGHWSYAAGTTTRVCPGEAGTDAPPEGDLVVGAGATPSELVVTEPGACALRFSLAGAVATIAPGQTCAGPDGAGGTITFTNMTWTLTLSGDGQTLAEALSADETLAPAGGAARTCKFTERDVTLRRR